MAKTRAPAESRTIRLDGQEVVYQLKRSARRRTIGMRIDHRGLTVNAPHRTAQSHLESVLQRRSNWLLEKLHEWQSNHPAPFAACHGERLLYLGGELALCLLQGPARSTPVLEEDALLLKLPDPADAAAVTRKLMLWYRAEAERHFSQRVAHYSGCMGLAQPRLTLSGARTRWGSCNARGDIRLNWRLIQAPISQIDYVVVHELAHLREFNHSPRFWAIVKEVLPHYEPAYRDLKTSGARYHRI